MGQAGKTREGRARHLLVSCRSSLRPVSANLDCFSPSLYRRREVCRQHNFPICLLVPNHPPRALDWPPVLCLEVEEWRGHHCVITASLHKLHLSLILLF